MYSIILIYFRVLHAEMKGISLPVWEEDLMGLKCRPCFMSFSLQGCSERIFLILRVMTHTLSSAGSGVGWAACWTFSSKTRLSFLQISDKMSTLRGFNCMSQTISRVLHHLSWEIVSVKCSLAKMQGRYIFTNGAKNIQKWFIFVI